MAETTDVTYPPDAVVVFPEEVDPSVFGGGYGVRVAIEDGELWVTIESALSGYASEPVNLSAGDAAALGSALIALARQVRV